MLAYVQLLMKDFLFALHPVKNRKDGESKAKTGAKLAGILLLIAMLYGMVVALEYFIFQGFLLIGNPDGMLAAVFLLCIFLTLFTSFFHVFFALFFSRDIAFASALPISSRGLLGAKLSMVLLSEAGIALILCLPAMVLYGIHTAAGVGFYLKTLLFIPLLPVLPIGAVTLLAFGFIRISALWKRREGVTTLVVFLLMTGVMIGQVGFSRYMGENASEELLLAFLLRNFNLVEVLAGFFPPLRWICAVFLTPGAGGWLYGLWIMLANFALLAALVFVLGKGYQTLAVRQSETIARLNAQGRRGRRSQKGRSPFMALYLRELKEIFSVPAYAGNCLAPLVMFPIMIAMLFMGMGGDSAEMAVVRIALERLPRLLYLIIAGGILSMTGSMNMAVSTAVSREGKRHDFSRIIPVAAKTQLLAKLSMGLTLNSLNALLSAAVLCALFPHFWAETLLALPIAALYSVLVCTLGLMMDARKPYFGWKSETEAVKRNVNGALSMLFSFLILGLLTGLFFLAQSMGLSMGGNLALSLVLMIAADVFLLLGLTGPIAKRYSLQ